MNRDIDVTLVECGWVVASEGTESSALGSMHIFFVSVQTLTQDLIPDR